MNNNRFLIVLLFALISGIITGILTAPFIFAPPNMKENVIQMTTENKTTHVSTVKKIEAPIYRGGATISIFSADSGTLDGMNTYIFHNAKLVELWPGTRQIKTVLSAKYARMIFASGSMSEVKESRWWGNLKRVQYDKRTE